MCWLAMIAPNSAILLPKLATDGVLFQVIVQAGNIFPLG